MEWGQDMEDSTGTVDEADSIHPCSLSGGMEVWSLSTDRVGFKKQAPKIFLDRAVNEARSLPSPFLVVLSRAWHEPG